jgi:two-component system sensor histidine kinase DegS
MKRKRKELSRRYVAALRKHLAKGPRANSHPAERLGRQALSAGLGTLDLARIHEDALTKLTPRFSLASSDGKVTQAAVFFVEALVPIEKTRRAAAESTERLNQLNVVLGRRTKDLVATNRQLKEEIIQRRVVEKALKRSEQHYNNLLEDSLHLQEQLRRVSHQILSAHEEERRAISRELHDEIGQSLTGINITLATLSKEAAVNTRGLNKKIASTQRVVEKSMKAVHRFAIQLRPPVLDDLGLIPALHSHVKEFAQRTRIRIRFSAITAVERLDNEKRTVLYRVVQEALTNVAKHAQATLANVRITRQLDGAICLEIHDNGKSFRVQRVLLGKGRKRLGLLGMRERVEMVGGRFTVESAPSKGTTIRAQIPLKNGSRVHQSSR